MIKGIKGHSNTEWCSVPIIENTENERELTDSLKFAIMAYPRSQAVLVRNHGIILLYYFKVFMYVERLGKKRKYMLSVMIIYFKLAFNLDK